VATVLGDLAESLDAAMLVLAARTAPIPWAQRLGFLLETVGAKETVEPLKSYVRTQARQMAVLLPAASHDGVRRDDGWKLFINASVEAEL
jgi:hypothetical protein